MDRISHILAREVLDSRGNPTVEVEVHCDGGACGRAIVPSGASTGTAEALELRDSDPMRYDGRGVLRAVENVDRVIGPAIVGCDALDQHRIDSVLVELDGTPRKTNLGANALLGVSLATAHAAAAAACVPLYRHIEQLWREAMRRHQQIDQILTKQKTEPAASAAGVAPPMMPTPFMLQKLRGLTHTAQQAWRMPLPMINMISGGLHAGGNLDFQDFLIIPIGAESFEVGLQWAAWIYRRLGRLLAAAGLEGHLVGDEGGYGPRLGDDRDALMMIVRAIEDAGLRPGEDVALAIDVAASQLHCEGRYELRAAGSCLDAREMIDHLVALVDEFPIRSIEDPLAEDDWNHWSALTDRLGNRIQIVGDDLFASRIDRLGRGIAQRVANAVLIKPNQVGTLSETLDTMALARAARYACIISARSGESEDTTIADLAVGTGAGQIKIGSVVRGERTAKYNRLLRIAAELFGRPLS